MTSRKKYSSAVGFLILSILAIACVGRSDHESDSTDQPAQVELKWIQESPTLDTVLAHDRIRRQLIALTAVSFETWEWRADHWIRIETPHRPPAMIWQEACFLPAVAATILLGRPLELVEGAPPLELWSYDGSDWIRLTPDHMPDCWFGRLVYDSVHERLLYTAGSTQPAEEGFDRFTVWAYDGTDWTDLPAVTMINQGLSEVALGYDPVRDRLVLSGRHPAYSDGYWYDVWEYDGQGWLLVNSSTSQPVIGKMVFDELHGQLLAFTGRVSDNDPDYTQTYRYGEGTWTLLDQRDGYFTGDNQLVNPDDHLIYALRAGVTTTFASDTGWTVRSRPDTPVNPKLPLAAWSTVLGRVVIVLKNEFFDQISETWTWDGRNFSKLAAELPPPSTLQLESAAVVANESEGTLYLIDYMSHEITVRMFTGNEWQPFAGPFHIDDHFDNFQAAYFPPRQSIILYAAVLEDGAVPESEKTFEFKNGTFTLLESDSGPTPRIDAAMGYDARFDGLVLFGGSTIRDGYAWSFNDTWLFDGIRWQAIDQLEAPSFRAGMTLAFDPSINRLVLIGGLCGSATGNGDVWEWYGNSWRRHGSNSGMLDRYRAASANDPVRHVRVIFGGSQGSDSDSEIDASLVEVSFEQ